MMEATRWYFCDRHKTAGAGQCAYCAREREALFPDAPDVLALRLNVQSQTIGHLLTENAELKRRVVELEHGRIASQRAHNALADFVDDLTEAHNRLVAYAVSLEDRL